MGFKKVYTAKELIESAPSKIPMLLEDIFPKVGLVALAGSSDTGKSSLLRQFAVAVCTDADSFLDIEINPSRNAVTYISTEDDSNALKVLLKKSFHQYAKELDEMFVIEEITHKTLYADLTELLKKHPCDAVVIDSTSDIIRGDMNSQSVVRGSLAVFDRIAKEQQCLMVFLHHINKSAKGQADKNQLNGSQAFEAKMRAVLVLGKPDGYSSNERTLQVVKGNYTPAEIKKKPMLLEFDETTLTFSNKGYANTSVESKKNSEEELSTMVKNYKDDGLTVRKIAEAMTNKGFPIGKTKVSELLRDL